MIHFYGLAVNEYFNLDSHTESSLWEAIPIIEAQKMLEETRVSMWPNLKPDYRSNEHKKLYDIGYPRNIFPRKKITLEEFFGVNGGGLGV